MTGGATVAGNPGRLRAVRNAVLLRILQRDPGEVERRAARFAITDPEGKSLVAGLGAAFLNGYNAMLRLPSTRAVADAGLKVESRFRPFFFEGAAMGYLPRGYLDGRFVPQNAVRDLLEMHPGFLYLYYVGIGFWFGMRHPRNPSRIERLAPHLDPLYLPLCYDGFGFKVGFFDRQTVAGARRRLDRSPVERRDAAYQGFGRSLFFVYKDDEAGFLRQRGSAPPEHRLDIEFGRSLALAFTGIERPDRLLGHIDAAAHDDDFAARLLGVTWALTARAMNDPDYLDRSLAAITPTSRDLLTPLPDLCGKARIASRDYAGWQARTRDAAVRHFAAQRSRGTTGGAG